MQIISKLREYIPEKKGLLTGALFLSATSSLLGILPFVFIWLLVRELLNTQTPPSQALVSTYAWWASGTALGGVLLYFLALTLSHLAAFRLENNIRRQAMQKIVHFPLGFFDNNPSGRIRKIIDDNAGITHMFLAHQLPDLAGSILMPLISLVLLFVFDWRLGLACLIPIVTALTITRFMIGEQGRRIMREYMTSLEDMNAEAVEYVRGIPVVKVFQQTVFSFKNFYDSIIRYRDMVHSFAVTREKSLASYVTTIHAFAYILIPLSILLIGNSEDYSSILLDLIFYILITPVFAQCIMKNMYMNQAVGQAVEAIRRIEELTDVKQLDVTDDPQPITNHEIAFKEVSFTYPGNNSKAVEDIKFTIPQGKTYALVGPSGGGKTTIARFIPRFWDADTGQVSIGGVDVRDVAPKELMRHVSFVFQNTKLFKTSLIDNLRYGNAHASEEAVNRALDWAQCREIIDRLPNGLNTVIGSEGTYLSGGEQQRIALARAILKDAPVVVLDEATAFSDPENEHLIQRALNKLTQGKTVLTIAHRLNNVVDVDSILVIDKGAVVEQGKHEELLRKEGTYAGMWNEFQKSLQWTVGKEVCND